MLSEVFIVPIIALVGLVLPVLLAVPNLRSSTSVPVMPEPASPAASLPSPAASSSVSYLKSRLASLPLQTTSVSVTGKRGSSGEGVVAHLTLRLTLRRTLLSLALCRSPPSLSVALAPIRSLPLPLLVALTSMPCALSTADRDAWPVDSAPLASNDDDSEDEEARFDVRSNFAREPRELLKVQRERYIEIEGPGDEDDDAVVGDEAVEGEEAAHLHQQVRLPQLETISYGSHWLCLQLPTLDDFLPAPSGQPHRDRKHGLCCTHKFHSLFVKLHHQNCSLVLPTIAPTRASAPTPLPPAPPAVIASSSLASAPPSCPPILDGLLKTFVQPATKRDISARPAKCAKPNRDPKGKGRAEDSNNNGDDKDDVDGYGNTGSIGAGSDEPCPEEPDVRLAELEDDAIDQLADRAGGRATHPRTRSAGSTRTSSLIITARLLAFVHGGSKARHRTSRQHHDPQREHVRADKLHCKRRPLAPS